MKREIDIFCEVIDNFGDVGVVFRLGKLLSQNHSVRIFIDSLKELKLLEPKCDDSVGVQSIDGIEYITFEYLEKNIEKISPREVIIEAFGCNINEKYMEKAKNESSLLINLEYLSSEEWTVGFHGNESMLGAKKLRKFFFIPGLLEGTGGVLFDKVKLENIKNLSSEEKEIKLNSFLPKFSNEFRKGKKIGTVFSYEKNFINLLETLNNEKQESILLIMGEKSTDSMKKLKRMLESDSKFDVEKMEDGILRIGKCYIEYFPFIPQEEYDELIMLTDFNFVRGEDSFVRAALSGVPFLWHIYLQDERVHLEKLQSFLEVYKNFFVKNYPGRFDKTLRDYEKIMIQYNDRDENSMKIYEEDFSLFFKNMECLREMGETYSEHILKNHNLIDKLNRFIEEKML